jgi:hypothetical protein
MKQQAETMGIHAIINSTLCSWKQTLDCIGVNSIFVETIPNSLEAYTKKYPYLLTGKKKNLLRSYSGYCDVFYV